MSNIIKYTDVRDYFFGVKGSWDYSKDIYGNWHIKLNDGDVIEDFYKNYYTHCEGDTTSKYGFFGSFISRLKIKDGEYLNNVLSTFETNGCVLDFGCGSGAIFNNRIWSTWDKYGYDFDPNVAACGNSLNFKYIPYDSIGNMKFDLIMMNHVVEHLEFPCEVLKFLKRCMNEKSVLLIRTPNADSTSHRFFKKFWRGIEAPRHLVVYSLSGIHNLLNSLGLTVVEHSIRVDGSGSIFTKSLMAAMGFRRIQVAPESLIQKIFRNVFDIIIRILHKLRLYSGDEIMLVCKKKY